MATRPVPAKVVNSGKELGGYISTWRKLRGLTMSQVAERAGITRDTVSRLERGEVTVGLDTFLGVLRALDRLDAVVDSLDPFETDFGRARATQILPKRVRT
jgi:transcriptional regulator with XRE-family HTH domain